MRILQVVHAFPPYEWAGTELVTLSLAQALRDRGHAVTVFTRVGDPQATECSVHEETMDGLPVIRIVNNYTRSSTFRLLYDNPFLNQPFLQLLNRLQPEIVHFQHVHHLSVSLLRLAAALGYPTVLSLHDFFFACHRIHLIDAQMRLCPGPERGERCVACLQQSASPGEARHRFADMERVLREPNLVLTPSVFLAKKMQGYFPFLEKRLRAVPLGVPPVPGLVQERPPRSSHAPLRILYVGVLAPHKGAHVLIEALKGLPPDAIAVSLYGMVDPFWQSYTDRLQEEARKLPVQFHGIYSHDQVGSILSQHDVLVMPMVWEETFSILTREALLSGLPVVAARRGALIEAIEDGVNGLFFEPENAADLRRCLTRLIAEPGLLERLCPVDLHVKTMDEYARDIEQIYEELTLTPHLRSDRKLSESVPDPQVPSPLAGEVQDGGELDSPMTGHPLTLSFSHEGRGHLVPREQAEERKGLVPTVRVSVCIPTYNGAEFIAEAIKSVLAQIFQDFELLVVDDRSTDATLEIVRSFSEPRIRIYQNEARRGIPGNWNRCLELAQGEYICLFHQDDVMLPENLERKVQVLDTDPAISLVHSAAEVLLEDSAPCPLPNWIEDATGDFVVDGTMYFRKLFFHGNLICAPAVVARRQPLLDLEGFDEGLGYTPDYEMWMKACVGHRVAFLSQPLILYRWHGKNTQHVYRFERGVEECILAGRRALQYYLEQTGRQDEGEVMQAALEMFTEPRRRAAQLERCSESQQAYIKQLEQERDKFWAEVQRVGHGWEEQKAYIESQQAYIKELEQERDRLWAEVQRVGHEWEEQKAYIDNQRAYSKGLEQERGWLIAGRERLLPRWLRRLARKVWVHTRSA